MNPYKKQWRQRIFRLQKFSGWLRQAQINRTRLYYVSGVTSYIHVRAHVLWTLTLAPV